MVVASLIAWPATQLTVAQNEPPFTLGLSWFAITLTALDVLLTADVREKEDDRDG
jgi:hypothetical protein